jgi:hypothetical protein
VSLIGALLTLSHEDSAPPINGSIYPQTNVLTSLRQRVRDIPSKSLTVEESLQEDAIGLNETTIALRTNDGHYVCAKKHETLDGDVIYYFDETSTSISDCEKFLLINLGNYQVAFKARNEGYVMDDEWSFQVPNGEFLCADDGDVIKASRDKIGPWETF